MIDDNSAAAEVMADNDRIVADFWRTLNDFSDSLDRMLQRERVTHEEWMRELRRDEE